MNLRDQLKIDMQQTFLNPHEFADIHTVDGRQIRAVIAEDTDNQHPLNYSEGVSLVRIIAYFDAFELGVRPRKGVMMTIDGTKYEVIRVSDEIGIYVVTLEANAD
ncbi:hypothetical protein AB4Z21_02290 [Paenibacillus sp. MCAF20]